MIRTTLICCVLAAFSLGVTCVQPPAPPVPPVNDCNLNGTADDLDIANGISPDCNASGVPDECELADNDCNATGVPDDCELEGSDCNENGIPDECDLAGGASRDFNGNGVPDECEGQDCNSNGVEDVEEILNGEAPDCDGNLVPDECELAGNDCNANGILDACDISAGTSPDCNVNGFPDECDIPPLGTGPDCNEDGIPDDCQIAGNDCNNDFIPDDCQLVDNDCNQDGIPDDCQLEGNDANGDGIPDDCGVSIDIDLLVVDRRADPLGFRLGSGTVNNPGALFGLDLRAGLSPILTVIAEPDPDGSGPFFVEPRAVAADGMGNFIMLHRGAPTAIPAVPGFVMRVSPEGVPTVVSPTNPTLWEPIFTASADPDDPRGLEYIAVDKNGDYLFTVSRTDARSVVRMTPTGTANFVSTDGLLSNPRGVLVDLCGNIVVADTGPDALIVIDPTGSVDDNAEILVQNPIGNDAWLKVRDVALDGMGNYIVLDESSSGAVFHVDRQTLAVTKVASHDPFFSQPRSIAVHANGNYYVVDRVQNTIFEIAPFPAVDVVMPVPADTSSFVDLANIRPNRVVTGVVVSGPVTVDECGTAAFAAEAVFSDGFSLDLGGCAEWSFGDGAPAPETGMSITADGVLTVGVVDADGELTLRATYSDKGITVYGELTITLINIGDISCP